MPRIVIIGGGIAGLAAAYAAGNLAGETASITVLERTDYWGGKVVTDRIPFEDGQFVIEGGPDTMVATKPWGLGLCRELGIAARLKGTNPHNRSTYILKNGQLHELPGGLTMMIPTEFGPMIRTGLLSWLDKARMGLDFVLPPAPLNGDETLGTFVTRRLGRAAYENLIEPLMSGIYAGDGDRLSLKSTFPNLRELELEHGGLVKGALALRKERQCKIAVGATAGKHGTTAPGSGSIFLSPESGLAEIVEALVSCLEKRGIDMRLDTPVERVRPAGSGYTLDLADGNFLEAEGVIIAVPSYAASELIAGFAPALAGELLLIEYASTATVTLAYRESDLPRPLNGYGYVIPRRENRRALACTWTSTKFPHRAPQGCALLRVFVGRAGQENDIPWEDDSLLNLALEELRVTMGITALPLITRVFRWEKAMPQYNLGHPERLQRIEALVESYPGLALAGNAYQGIGIPDCIHSGEMAAARIFATVKETIM